MGDSPLSGLGGGVSAASHQVSDLRGVRVKRSPASDGRPVRQPALRRRKQPSRVRRWATSASRPGSSRPLRPPSPNSSAGRPAKYSTTSGREIHGPGLREHDLEKGLQPGHPRCGVQHRLVLGLQGPRGMVRRYRRDAPRRLLQLIQRVARHIDALITHGFPMSQVTEAWQLLLTGARGKISSLTLSAAPPASEAGRRG